MENRTEELKLNSSEKLNFTVGLAAVIIAMYPFKDIAQSIEVDFFLFKLSLFSLLGCFLLIIFVSLYFSGLNNIRYCFPKIFSGVLLSKTKIIEIFADFLYSLAFLYPIILLVTWTILFALSFLKSKISSDVENVINIIALSIMPIFSVVLAEKMYKIKETALINEMQEMQNSLLINSQNIYRDGDYRLSILSLYEAVIASLNSHLVNKMGLGIEKISPSYLIEIATSQKVLTESEKMIILDLRKMRNQIAHNVPSTQINPKQAKEFHERIMPILKKLRKTSILASFMP